MTRKRKGLFGLLALVAAALTAWCGTVLAQTEPIASPPNLASDVYAYWTPERMASAQPMPLPIASSFTPAGSFVASVGSEPVSSPSYDSNDGSSDEELLFDPSMQDTTVFSVDESTSPTGEGTFLAPYTSNRLVTTGMDKNKLYKKVGKLFFTIPGQGNFVCSAAVISYRLVATAGHCVASGTGTWYTNHLFVPAFRSGNAPYQSWAATQLWTNTDWFNGGGGVPNAHDQAIMIMQDRFFGTRLTKIGKKVGFFGWRTLSLSRNHVHQLGYPCNLDSCNRMHEVTTGDFRDVAPNNVEYGSDMRGGSSGGPWVQNFGYAATGQADTGNRNEIVGITSYTYVSNDPKVLGSSILDNVWVAVWNAACGAQPGNCTLK